MLTLAGMGLLHVGKHSQNSNSLQGEESLMLGKVDATPRPQGSQMLPYFSTLGGNSLMTISGPQREGVTCTEDSSPLPSLPRAAFFLSHNT